MVAAVLVLLVLKRVLCLVSKEGTGDCAEETVATRFVAAKVACSAAADSTQETTIALGLRVGVGGAVALLGRSAVLGLLAMGILFLWVGALLRELLGWGLARVLMLSVLSLALAVLILGTLPMLETTLGGGSVASVLLRGRRLLAVVAGGLGWWLLLILLVVALIVPLRRGSVALAGRGRAVLAVRGVLLLAVALVVLVVRARHGEVGGREDGGGLGRWRVGEGGGRGGVIEG